MTLKTKGSNHGQTTISMQFYGFGNYVDYICIVYSDTEK